MSNKKDTGVYQLDNGYWAYRYKINIDGVVKEKRRRTDELGKPFKTKTSAVKARQQAIVNEKVNAAVPQPKRIRKTVAQVYDEYCEFGRAGKAYATIKKQDSLWNNHIKAKFGKRYVDDITAAEINDYLSNLYYTENRAYNYTESFLKIFYLIFGQAYSRNYLNAEQYDKLCKNKDTKIHMPKMKVDEDTDIVTFSDDLDAAYMQIGRRFMEKAARTQDLCGLEIQDMLRVMQPKAARKKELEKRIAMIEKEVREILTCTIGEIDKSRYVSYFSTVP